MENFYEANPLDGTEKSRRKQLQELFKLDVETNYDAQCAESRGNGCSLKWNLERQYFLNGFNDGEYEIRSKTFCSGYDAFATSEVRSSVTDENLRLFVDVKAPKATQTLTLDRVLRIEFTEKILCPQLNDKAMVYEIKHVKTCDGAAVENGKVSDTIVYGTYDFVCTNDPPYALVVEIPDNDSTPDGTYEITVNANIDGDNGDKIADVGRNPVKKQTFLVTLGSCETTMATLKTMTGLGTAKKEREIAPRSKKDLLFLISSSVLSFLSGITVVALRKRAMSDKADLADGARHTFFDAKKLSVAYGSVI